jgi:hypothetical protein
MIDILYSYVTIFCTWRVLLQDLTDKLPEVSLALEVLAGGYVVPTALALMALVRWFEGTTVAERAANQRAVLRGLLAALTAWGLAAAIGWAWQEGLSDPGWEYVLSDWTCWQGTPFPNLAAAAGVALGAASWRQDWRWSLRCLLATGLWAGAQACLGLYYPVDAVVGTFLGAILGWSLSTVGWLDRRLEMFVRLARRWMLA